MRMNAKRFGFVRSALLLLTALFLLVAVGRLSVNSAEVSVAPAEEYQQIGEAALMPEVIETRPTVPMETKPEVAEPETTEPEVSEPETTEPEVSEPETTEPEVSEPETTEPEVSEPKATEPKATEPKATEPKATEPKATEPKATEPKATEPKATEPKATEPKATEPKATEPKATEPKATEPKATEPIATEPEATEPKATEPKATEPIATEPEATEPKATEPKATEPVATEPEATEPKATEPEEMEPELPSVYDISTYSMGSMERQVVDEINKRRVEAGLEALEIDPKLCALATIRAYEASEKWSHTRPDGRSSFSIYADYGYSYSYAGENLLYSSYKCSAFRMANNWMNSPSHQAVMLNEDYTTIGIGLYYVNNRVYVAGLFVS